MILDFHKIQIINLKCGQNMEQELLVQIWYTPKEANELKIWLKQYPFSFPWKRELFSHEWLSPTQCTNFINEFLGHSAVINLLLPICLHRDFCTFFFFLIVDDSSVTWIAIEIANYKGYTLNKIKLNHSQLPVKKLMVHNFIYGTSKLLVQLRKGTLQKKQNDPTWIQYECSNLQGRAGSITFLSYLSSIIIDVYVLISFRSIQVNFSSFPMLGFVYSLAGLFDVLYSILHYNV